MNQPPHSEALYRVAAETLESLALMFLVGQDEAPQPLPACDRRVAVTFAGPFSGALVVAASESVLPELAANMLGLEGGCASTPGQQEDALKELANVICGNLLPAIAGKEPVFHVGSPEVLSAEGPAWLADGPPLAGKARLFADAGVLDLEFLAGPSARA